MTTTQTPVDALMALVKKLVYDVDYLAPEEVIEADIAAVEASARALAAIPAKRCPYCDDTGDVHSIDGEWRGRCTCPAGQSAPHPEPVAPPAREALTDDEITLLLADKIGFGDSDLQTVNRGDLVSIIRAVEAAVFSATPPAQAVQTELGPMHAVAAYASLKVRYDALQTDSMSSKPHPCRGIPRKGCNYLATCGMVCNKCGEVHHLHQMPGYGAPQDLRDKLQRQCTTWSAYWRASDAHGVELTKDQAVELLREALSVEVEIKDNQS